MSRVDEPQYTVLSSEGNIQTRDYGPTIIAEVEVRGERLQAIKQGFRMIADYIFGNNAPAQKIAMTAPVTQQAGEKIAMTAPVIQQGSGDVWKVRFVMPQNYTLETLPKPNNTQVQLLSTPSRRVVVIRFSGSNTDSNLNAHREELLRYAVRNNLKPVGEPIFAFYNPPWTLPFLKRNEVIWELEEIASSKN